MQLSPGNRLKSGTCSTEIIIVKAPAEETVITCGGSPMGIPGEETETAISPEASEGTQLGKRYVNEDETLEVLCTKSGDGSLGIGDTLLAVKEAKPLPASD